MGAFAIYTTPPGHWMVRSPSTQTFTEEEEREIMKLATILVRLGGQKKRKRQRTSPEQLLILEEIFKGNRTPDFETRDRLSKQLCMTPRRIQIWFQNKRAKMKKLQQENKNFHFDSERSGSNASAKSSEDGSPLSSDNESSESPRFEKPSFPSFSRASLDDSMTSEEQ